MTYEVQDTELKTITAYDKSGKRYILDAQVPPNYPVVILSLYERINPNTGELRSVEGKRESEKYDREYAAKLQPYLLQQPPVDLTKMKDVIQTGGLKKVASSPNPQTIYLEWFRTLNTQDPWPASDGEFWAGIAADAGALHNNPYKILFM